MTDLAGPNLRITAGAAGGRTVVAAAGELDLASADELAAAVAAPLARGPVVLDLAGLEFMDSSGVRVLGALLREAAARGHALAVRGPLAANVAQVLRITGMMEVLPMEGEA